MRIDLNKIIKEQELVPWILSRQLWPTNAFPMQALKRVTEGTAQLEEEQIAKLAHITGLSIDELFQAAPWKITNSGENLLHFERDNWKASFDLESNAIKVYDKETLYCETLLVSKAIPLNEFLTILDNLVTSNK